MARNSDPIGIFDSGIGGLTVASAIRKKLPQERLIYFGDTAHLPYGDKAPGSIRSYAVRIVDFLLSQNCKLIVIACNSASSIAYQKVKEHVGRKCSVIDVISPVVSHVTSLKNMHKVGVIGTRATIRSKEYPRQIHERKKQVEVVSQATPLLAPMIEEGFFNNNISRTVIHSYLSKPKLKELDSLILACTHYPLIMPEISEFYHNNVRIINTAEVVASKVKETLRRRQLLASRRTGPHHFYVSDYTRSFEESTRIFFEGEISLEHRNLWS